MNQAELNGQIERVYIKTKICLVRTINHGYLREGTRN
jgi:hypothetical protein